MLCYNGIMVQWVIRQYGMLYWVLDHETVGYKAVGYAIMGSGTWHSGL